MAKDDADDGSDDKGRDVAAENTDFWLATCTVGPVMFLAIGVLIVELDRERGGIRWRRPAQRVQIIAVNVAFIGTLLPTVAAILSLAWRSDLLPPKLVAVVLVASFVGFWISLVAHFTDIDKTSGRDE